MSILLLKRYKNMVLIGIFCFYLGCGITVSFLSVGCADAESRTDVNNHKKSHYGNEYEYAVLVLSGPENRELRDTIRNTWGRLVYNLMLDKGEIVYSWNQTIGNNKRTENYPLVKLWFAICTQFLSDTDLTNLNAENNNNNDLLLLDNLKDSYKNLAAKVLHSLKWISANMKSVKYVLKSDDDSFVRVDLIVNELERYAPYMDAPEIRDYVSLKNSLPAYKGLYWGYFNGHAKVYFTGKWQENNWFLCDTYLPYALGGGYVISRSIVDYLVRNMNDLSYYASEDVSMGTWTAALDAINRVHDVRFDTEWRSRGCLNEMLIRHKQTSANMVKLFKSLTYSSGTKLCNVEKLNRKPYSYNWSIKPSKCCEKFT